MKISHLPLILSLCLSSFSALAQQAIKDNGYFVVEEETRTGSMLKRKILTYSALPFDKSYEELNAEQKALLRSGYEAMPETDEPPYPIGGPAKIYLGIYKGFRKLGLQSGQVALLVDVNSQGSAENVSVLETPDIDLGKFAAKMMVLQKYKPAVCGGKPCKMQYLAEFVFKNE
jgi:hypothetical protein